MADQIIPNDWHGEDIIDDEEFDSDDPFGELQEIDPFGGGN